jgi:hypothetical protein
LLAQYIQGWPCDRLILRLACRTPDWSEQLAEVLRDKFADVRTVELLPLRRRDVVLLLPSDIKADDFLAAVDRARAGALASRPLTLRLLAAIFRETGGLPDRSSEIYRQGLLYLCDEQDDVRRAAPAALSPTERLAIAGRLAAVSIFCGRPTYWTGPTAECPQRHVSLDECCGGVEALDGTEIAVNRRAIDETIRTGLFTGRGERVLGWGHVTFADFLAAEWINANALAPKQIDSLILAPDGLVYPQVRQSAAWLISIAPDQYGRLARADPESFASDVDLPAPALRAAVVDGLFDLAADDRLRRDFVTNYARLRHPEINAQVAAGLADTSVPILQLAIRLARDCGLSDQIPTLAAIATNVELPDRIRVSAMWAIQDLNHDAPFSGVRSLIENLQARGDDPDDEVLGAALLTTWPHALSTVDVL